MLFLTFSFLSYAKVERSVSYRSKGYVFIQENTVFLFFPFEYFSPFPKMDFYFYGKKMIQFKQMNM